jgi:hypothetical protein
MRTLDPDPSITQLAAGQRPPTADHRQNAVWRIGREPFNRLPDGQSTDVTA